jgi:hypothetical protein
MSDNKVQQLKDIFPKGRISIGENILKLHTNSIGTSQFEDLAHLIQTTDVPLSVQAKRSGTGMTILFQW